MITLEVATVSGTRLGSVTEKSIGELDGDPSLVDMLQRMLNARGVNSLTALDGWSNGYLLLRSASAVLPGPAEDNRPRKFDGKFNTKRLPE